MHRSSINIATLIILFSFLTVLFQFGAYYFLDPVFIVYGIAALFSLIFSHVFLEQTLSYESCFSYTLLNIFLCTIILLLSYFGGNNSLITYHPDLTIFIILNWIIPVLYCVIRNLSDQSLKYNDFNKFYRNINIIFIIFYIGILITLLFFKNKSFVEHYTDFNASNMIPFLTLATLIEDYITGYIASDIIIKYLVQGIVLFIPYGFYAILFLRYQSRLLRLLGLLVLPVLVEILQTIFKLGKTDIDDILLGLLGGFIGAILYHTVNRIYRTFTDEDFLYDRHRSSFINSSLHF
ncbi:MAG: VanZ family protein [Anaerocolumna sp.]